MIKPEWRDMEIEEFKKWFESLDDDEKMRGWAEGAAIVESVTKTWQEYVEEVLRPAWAQFVTNLNGAWEFYQKHIGGKDEEATP